MGIRGAQGSLLCQLDSECTETTYTSGNQFDVDGAILKALAGLKVNLTVDSGLKLDDCEFVHLHRVAVIWGLTVSLDATQLSFTQSSVPAQVRLIRCQPK